ncbi:hypothetical protein COB64_03395 [Candidatus Wolfebacteria bacterium]|nr:MAG: hypothetical protein COB64_03395 [Candidatus Wolfebacteria bacterium]
MATKKKKSVSTRAKKTKTVSAESPVQSNGKKKSTIALKKVHTTKKKQSPTKKPLTSKKRTTPVYTREKTPKNKSGILIDSFSWSFGGLKTTKSERTHLSLLLLVVILSSFYFGGIFKEKQIQNSLNVAAVAAANPFANVDLEAEVAYVYDAETGELVYGLHEDKPLPIASITKVMTAIVALDVLEEDSVVTVTSNALDQEGYYALYLNEKWRLSDLTELMLIMSSNDAAQAIAFASDAKMRGVASSSSVDVFVERMNEKARSIGMTNTVFGNATGLDIGDEPGSFASAKDVVALLNYAMDTHPDIFKVTSKENSTLTSLDLIEHEIENTNTILKTFKGITSSKTGHTTLAGGSLVVEYKADNGRSYVVSVLGSSKQGRFSDMQQLLSASAALSF